MNFHDLFQHLFGFRREPEDFRQHDKINEESEKEFLDDFFRKTPNIWMFGDHNSEEKDDTERHSGSKTGLFQFDEALREPFEMFKHFQKIFLNFGMLEHLSPPETATHGLSLVKHKGIQPISASHEIEQLGVGYFKCRERGPPIALFLEHCSPGLPIELYTPYSTSGARQYLPHSVSSH
ncbi:uncharacterized protein LOC143236086 [Tachypleus tridentatus]|uniref:uncharacterized protein LOC143236086 n=1 Tax=Tachypleus tridentatus TaxID=6853 RepID=UPI003FD3869F